MGMVQEVISQQSDRANAFASKATEAINALVQQSSSAPYSGGFAHLNTLTIPPYAAPQPSTAVTPTFDRPPTTPLTPTFGTITPIIAPPPPNVPTIALPGFNFTAPSPNIPSFNQSAPSIDTASLAAEMHSVAMPHLKNYQFPEVHTFKAVAPPDLNIPNYVAPPPMDELGDPADYAAKFQTAYTQMSPAMQAFVEDKANNWITTYCPEYATWSVGLKNKINDGFNGQALSDQFEAAMFARAQDRATLEFDKQSANIYSDFSRNGFMEPPGTTTSKLFSLKLQRADSLASQATDIYIERRKTEIQHAQFCMNLASTQITAVRNAAIQYAQQVGANMAISLDYSKQVADKLMSTYEYFIKRADLRLTTLGVIDTQYNSKLKAALSAYDGYKLQLEAEKIKTEIDVVKTSQITAQIQAEGAQVQLYSAVLDGISKRVVLEDLKIKGYSLQADVFKNQLAAQVAGFDVYKAAMSGDVAKVEGELAKVKIFEAQVHANVANIDAQGKRTQAEAAANEAKTAVFRGQLDGYKAQIDSALNSFLGLVEVKKLSLSIESQQLGNAIEAHKVGTVVPTLQNDALLKEQEINSRIVVQNLVSAVGMAQVAVSARSAGAGAAASIAAAAIGALNGVVSESTNLSK